MKCCIPRDLVSNNNVQIAKRAELEAFAYTSNRNLKFLKFAGVENDKDYLDNVSDLTELSEDATADDASLENKVYRESIEAVDSDDNDFTDNEWENCGDVNAIGRVHTYLEVIGAINVGKVLIPPKTRRPYQRRQYEETVDGFYEFGNIPPTAILLITPANSDSWGKMRFRSTRKQRRRFCSSNQRGSRKSYNVKDDIYERNYPADFQLLTASTVMKVAGKQPYDLDLYSHKVEENTNYEETEITPFTTHEKGPSALSSYAYCQLKEYF
ncbi:hypothetical protein G9A89_016469 [Geosiphon pyriformis]|nr:hypothetical protein G9A89_016469 [Geosiphon pyriformis]